MLGVDDLQLRRSGSKMEGIYVCYRKTGIQDEFLKSIISIRKWDGDENSQKWEFVHYYYNKRGELRESDGIFLPINTNIFMFGDIEHGAGIDYILLKEPISSTFNFVEGFEVAIDRSHEPYFVKIVCVRAHDSSVGAALEDRKLMQNRVGIIDRSQLMGEKLGEIANLGEILLEQVFNYSDDFPIRLGRNDRIG
jgi:hypothetical protein